MLKAREQRTKVLTRARMRSGGSWSDVCIVNLSSRGVGLQGAVPPGKGTYVELRRGSHVLIVGRVMWASGHRFGLQTQDPIWIDGVIRDTGPEKAPVAEWRDRRAMPRTKSGGEWSRVRGRMMQFGFVVAGGICAVVAIGGMVDAAFAEPMRLLSDTMADTRLAAH